MPDSCIGCDFNRRLPLLSAPLAVYLILELCDGGELFDRLHAQTGSHYDEAQAARLMYQMCAAIACECYSVSRKELSYSFVLIVSFLPADCHFQGISHR